MVSTMKLRILGEKGRGAGGTPIQKCKARVVVGNTPKRYQDPVLWTWLEMVFTPKRYQF